MYGSDDGARAYHEATGNEAWSSLSLTERNAARFRSSAILDALYEPEFIGSRTDPLQPEAWPRRGPAVLAAGFYETDIPPAVVTATYELAWMVHSSPDAFRRVYEPGQLLKRKTVGPITKEFAVPDAGQVGLPDVPLLRGWLAPLLKGAGPRSGMPVLVV